MGGLDLNPNTVQSTINTVSNAVIDPVGAAAEQGGRLGKFIGEEIYYHRHGTSEALENVLERTKYGYAAGRMDLDDGPTLTEKFLAPTVHGDNAEQKSELGQNLEYAGAGLDALSGDLSAAGDILVSELKAEAESRAINAIAGASGSVLLGVAAVEGTKAGVGEYIDIGARHETTLLTISGEIRSYITEIEEGVAVEAGIVDYNDMGYSIPGFTASAFQIGDERFTVVIDASPFACGDDVYNIHVLNSRGEFINVDDYQNMLVELQNGDDPLLASQAGTASLGQNSMAVSALQELSEFASDVRVDEYGNELPTAIDSEAYNAAVDNILRESANDIGKVAAYSAAVIEQGSEARQELEAASSLEAAPDTSAPEQPAADTSQLYVSTPSAPGLG